MSTNQYLTVGTSTAFGNVVFHDCTKYELGRLCIEIDGKYPDIETWVQSLTSHGMIVKLHRYAEKLGRTGLAGYLWLYYVSAQRNERTNWHSWEA